MKIQFEKVIRSFNGQKCDLHSGAHSEVCMAVILARAHWLIKRALEPISPTQLKQYSLNQDSYDNIWMVNFSFKTKDHHRLQIQQDMFDMQIFSFSSSCLKQL